MKISISIVLGLFLMCMAVAPAKADPIKEGKWTMTMVTHIDTMSPEMAKAMQQMQNLPPQVQAMMQAHNIHMGGNGQDMTMTITHCVTTQNPVPHYAKGSDAKDCQQSHSIQGSTVTFQMSCNHNGFEMDSKGNMTYLGNSMQGYIKSHEVAQGGQPTDATIHVTGQYLGACDS
jgi:hypothetical protein